MFDGAFLFKLARLKTIIVLAPKRGPGWEEVR